jgi:acetyl esterase/lipase
MTLRRLGLSLLLSATLATSSLAAPAGPIPLYPGAAPGSEHAAQVEVSMPSPAGRMLRNITRPELLVFSPPPGTANGVGVIVAPGGGFHILSIDNEGTVVAQRLAALGLTVFVLKYRLNETPANDIAAMARMYAYLALIHGAPDGAPPVTEGETLATADAFQAMRLVRSHARDWALDPHRIGFLGFSAGAMLALKVGADDDAATRPDFLAAIYGVLRQGHAPLTAAPPLFIAAAADDSLLPGRSPLIYAAWKAAGRSAELHIYDHGGHGFGMLQQGVDSDRWFEAFTGWLQEHGFAPADRRP